MREDLWTTVKEVKPEKKDITSAWTRKDEKARWMIGLSLEDDQLGHIMDAETANEMWETLKGVHERGSLSNKIHTLRKLCSMRLDEDGNLSEHLMKASELVHRLTRMGESLKEHLVVAILLSSLPGSYDPLVTALEGRPEEDLKVDYVKGKLLDEWRRKNECRNKESVEDKAMKTTVHAESRRNFVRTCYYCGREGHLQRSCPVLLEETKCSMLKREQGKLVKHPTPESSGESSGSGRGVCFTVTTGSSVAITEKWILDTGCTKHMTNSTASFGWWNPCAEDVSLADGKIVKARGSGKGRITGVGLDGDQVEIKLKELLYVPGMSGNVLSVSRITDEGLTVVFGPRDCRIMDGSRVIAVGEKSGGLYYLKQ